MEKASFEIPLWNPKANSRAAVRAASVVLLALGAVGVVWSSAGVIKGRASTHWQPVSGKVVSLQWHSPSDGPDYPTIEYAFAFQGVQRTGSRIAFGPASAACSRLAGLVPGGPITVYVDPARPEEAVIEPGPSRFATGGLVISAGLVLAGLCVPLIARVARPQQT